MTAQLVDVVVCCKAALAAVCAEMSLQLVQVLLKAWPSLLPVYVIYCWHHSIS